MEPLCCVCDVVLVCWWWCGGGVGGYSVQVKEAQGQKIKEHNVQVCIKRGEREETENKYDG